MNDTNNNVGTRITKENIDIDEMFRVYLMYFQT